MRSTFAALIIVAVLSLAGAAYTQTGAGHHYADKVTGFAIDYPADFVLHSGPSAATEGYFGDPGVGKKLVKVSPRSVPAKYHGDYEFNVWVAGDQKDKCGKPGPDEFQEPDPDLKLPETRSVDGHTFYSYISFDGGMSKSISLVGYRGLVDGRCWQIQSVAQQTSAWEDFKEFDPKIIAAGFDRFLNGFHLIGGK